MEYGGGKEKNRFGLPENRDEEFDERTLEEAIRNGRRREFAVLASLNA